MEVQQDEAVTLLENALFENKLPNMSEPLPESNMRDVLQKILTYASAIDTVSPIAVTTSFKRLLTM